MKNYLMAASLLLCTALLASCSPTSYVAASDPNGYGYFEVPIDANTYEVTFHGNGYTNPSTDDNYSLYRSAEVTRQNGFDYFHVIDEGNNAQIKSSTSKSYAHTTKPETTTTTSGGVTTTTTSVEHSSSVDVSNSTTTEYTSQRTVRMYKGTPAPDDNTAYIAADILRTMSPYIKR